jgi:hypothetical protein
VREGKLNCHHPEVAESHKHAASYVQRLIPSNPYQHQESSWERFLGVQSSREDIDDDHDLCPPVKQIIYFKNEEVGNCECLIGMTCDP